MERRIENSGEICFGFKLNEDKQSIRTASINLRKASKEGLQSLYADPTEVLEKYKDFDIVKAMSEQQGEKLLWVRARAIDADTVNANGDYFSKEELLKDVEVKGQMIPAYKTFEGVPIYTNHENDDITKAKGQVIYAEWDEKENCVYCTFIIDEQAYPDIARGIRVGYMHDVSMGCQVEKGECSVCKNIAHTEKEYCKHMEKYKGKPCPDAGGEKAYEKNMGLKFIELSVVGDGAFDACEIEEIYDVDDILETALQDINKRAASITEQIFVAASQTKIQNTQQKEVFEDCLRQIATTTRQTVRLAQTAGTLVGGQLLAGQGAGQNTTVSNILQFLGIDAASGLNILDMLNLALNFLEVAVMNLFARKDNIDLAHVGKITKSMADLQATMQDMIDDGVDTGGGQKNAPLNQNALMQPAQLPGQMPGGQASGGNAPADYSEAGAVGKAIGPMPTQNNAFMLGTGFGGFGGGAIAKAENSKVVWASLDDEDGVRVTTASKNKDQQSSPRITTSLTNLREKLNSFASTLDINDKLVKNSNLENKNEITSNRVSGGKNMSSIFDNFVNYRKKKDMAFCTVDLNVADSSKENRVTLSSDGSVKVYHKGVRVAWEPEITDEQLARLENGGTEAVGAVAAEILKDFKKSVISSKAAGKQVVAWKDPSTNTGEVWENQIDKLRTGTDDDVKEKLLGDKAGEYGRQGFDNRVREETLDEVRTGTPELGKVKEDELGNDAGLYSRDFKDDKVKELLIQDARLGNPDVVIEEQLAKIRANSGSSDTAKTAEAAINALANAVVLAKVHPAEVMETAQKYASRNDFEELVALASLGTKNREVIASRREFYGINQPIEIKAALLSALGKEVSKEVSASDLADVVRIAVAEPMVLSKVSQIAKSKVDGSEINSSTRISKEDKIKAALAATVGKNTSSLQREHVKAAIGAFASSTIDTKSTPKEVVSAIAEVNADQLLFDVAEARTASAASARVTNRERRRFWGSTRTASKEDVYANIIGWLADYADSYKFDNTASIVSAAKIAADKQVVAEDLTARMITSMKKEAAVEITDEETKTKRIHCTVNDLGGIDIKSENFMEEFRQKAIEIMASCGYTVDPATFTLSDVNVTASGDVTASVTSRMSKSFNADSTPAMGADMGGTEVEVSAPDVTVEMPTETEDGAIMTASAKQKLMERKAARQELLKRVAQMPGMGATPPPAAGGMPGMGGGMGTTPSPLDGTLGENADAGVSSLTGTSEDAAPEGEDTDNIAEPGDKKPWGSVCPQCGSTDVDIANGEGNCRSCGAQLTYTFNVEVKPGNDESKNEEGAAAPEAPEAGAESPFGEETGLGAATAPGAEGMGGGATAPAANPMGGGMPGIMAKVQWDADSDAFVRLASVGKTSKILPVGFVCPSCGNREATKHLNTTYCEACGTISKTTVAAHPSDPTKIRCSITWLS